MGFHQSDEEIIRACVAELAGFFGVLAQLADDGFVPVEQGAQPAGDVGKFAGRVPALVRGGLRFVPDFQHFITYFPLIPP